MGSTTFYKEIESDTIRNAFDKMMDDIHRYHGCDYYNGYGGAAYLGRCVLTFDKFTNNNQKKASERIKKYFEDEEGNKNYLDCIDLGIVGYQVTTVKKQNNTSKNSTPKFKKMYIVRSGNYNDDKVLFSSEDKKKAEDEMLRVATRYPHARCVVGYELVAGNDVLSTVSVKRVMHKSKPSKVAANATVMALHKYIFFGWVPE